MNKLALVVAGILFSAPFLALPAKSSAQVDLDFNPWGCYVLGEELESTTQDCDLSLSKEVSINGGPFFAANDTASAPTAFTGDVVQYRITIDDVTNVDYEYYIAGTAFVYDFFPSGVSYLSHTASVGTYDPVAGNWLFTLSGSETYPLTLTINATALTEGEVENAAFLAGHLCDGLQIENACEYFDANSQNNGDNAWVNVFTAPVVLGETTAKPQVLAETTLAETGSGTLTSFVAGALLLIAVSIVAHGRLFKRSN